MTTHPETVALRQRTQRESYRDGLAELVAGAVLFIVALAAGRPAFYWTYLAVILLLGPGLQRLKARFTYPRIGLAKVPADDPKRFGAGFLIWTLGVLVVVGAMLLLGGQLGNNLAWRRMAPAIGGLLFAGGFIDLYRRTRLLRFMFLGFCSILLGGVMVAPVVAEPYGNLRVWALLLALVCLVSGGIALASFLKSTAEAKERQPLEEDDDDRG